MKIKCKKGGTKHMWLLYFFVINIIGYAVMRSDKRRAIEGAWRIPEKRIWLVTLLGGGVGTTIGMFRLHHKNKHWNFKLGLPAIMILEYGLIGYIQ